MFFLVEIDNKTEVDQQVSEMKKEILSIFNRQQPNESITVDDLLEIGKFPSFFNRSNYFLVNVTLLFLIVT